MTEAVQELRDFCTIAGISKSNLAILGPKHLNPDSVFSSFAYV